MYVFTKILIIKMNTILHLASPAHPPNPTNVMDVPTSHRCRPTSIFFPQQFQTYIHTATQMGSHVLVFSKQLHNIPTCSTISLSKEIYFVYSFVDFLTLNNKSTNIFVHISLYTEVLFLQDRLPTGEVLGRPLNFYFHSHRHIVFQKAKTLIFLLKIQLTSLLPPTNRHSQPQKNKVMSLLLQSRGKVSFQIILGHLELPFFQQSVQIICPIFSIGYLCFS